ncbi:hypothetical protein, partial [Nostoc commune]|uniref:hypothetical protein n=1 Tax=Nostoc commune TaxID=1178 RepID=UPI001E5BE090
PKTSLVELRYLLIAVPIQMRYNIIILAFSGKSDPNRGKIVPVTFAQAQRRTLIWIDLKKDR